jgi:hypothetical protein
VPILVGKVAHCVGAQRSDEILARQWAIITVQQGQIDADPPGRHEVPTAHPINVPMRAQADPDRQVPGAVAELHPHIAVGGLLTAVEQVGLHRPLLAGKRIQPARLDPPIQHVREDHLKRLGLARAIGAAQGEPAVDEEEFLVAVIPEVDDSRSGGAEACHGIP